MHAPVDQHRTRRETDHHLWAAHEHNGRLGIEGHPVEETRHQPDRATPVRSRSVDGHLYIGPLLAPAAEIIVEDDLIRSACSDCTTRCSAPPETGRGGELSTAVRRGASPIPPAMTMASAPARSPTPQSVPKGPRTPTTVPIAALHNAWDTGPHRERCAR